MSKHLPKVALSTMSEIHRASADAGIDDSAAAVATDPAAHAAADVVPAAGIRPPGDAALHRAQALLIVERYTTYSALGGCIPLALFDSLSVGAITFTMVRALAEHYRAPFRQDQVKAGIAALVAGVASPSLGSMAGQIVARIIPGAWLVSTAVSSATAASLTRYIGNAFVEYFASDDAARDLDIAKLRAYCR